MGTPDFAAVSLKALIDAGHSVSAVFTQPDKPRGRGMKLVPSPVKEIAEEHGITVFQPQSLKKESGVYTPIIRELCPDCIAVVAYGKILPPEVLSVPKYGCVNVHGSLLPKLRGAAPIQWTVLSGEEFGGVTTMLMGEGMDTGDMLLKESVRIGSTETSSELFDRLAPIGAELLVKTLALLEKGDITPIPQDEALATYAPMLTKDLCPTDFNDTAERVCAHINGLSDRPGATAAIDGKRLKLLRAEAVSCPSGHLPGEVIDPKIPTVACKTGAVRLIEIQAEGSKRMSADDYLRGHPLKKGSVFTPDI